MVWLVFRPYTQVWRSICTSESLRASTITSFSLCKSRKNNGLSNCSILTLLSTHFVKSCCSAVLFFDTDQNQSISTGKGWSKPEIIISIPSPVVLRLHSLALMLFSLYKPKTISTWLHGLKRKLNVLQRLMRKSLYVSRFCFFIDTFLAYTMKSIITLLCCWRQMRWNIFCYHTFDFSYQFRLIWLSDQTSFCKINAYRWDFITHENFKIEISQASIVNMM